MADDMAILAENKEGLGNRLIWIDKITGYVYTTNIKVNKTNVLHTINLKQRNGLR